ncbi:MAG TPA: TolC family protein [Kofleriaceae bacterium]|jgi:outer membrane protein TolC
MRISKVAVVAVVVIAGSAQADSLTLPQAIQLAMTRNERAEIAKLDVTIADAQLAQARTAFLPIVDASGQAQYRPRNDPSVTANGTLALSQPIFQPTVFPLYSQAKHTLAARQAQSIDDQRRLAYDAANAFLDVLLAEEVLQAAQRKLETAQVNVKTTTAQKEAQLVSSNDVTRAELDLASAERELAGSKGDVEARYVDLELVINQRVSPGLTAPAELLTAGTQTVSADTGLIQQSVGRRADLVASKEVAAAAKEFAKVPRAAYLPSFDFVAQITATTDDRNGNTVDGLLGISAKWTLWDSGERSAQARQRDAQTRIAELQAQQLAREIDADVRSAVATLSSRQQALTAAATARDAARKGADEAAILYKQGLAKAIELVDANEQRFIAEVNYATSEFDVERAYLALRLAMGLDPVEGQK